MHARRVVSNRVSTTRLRKAKSTAQIRAAAVEALESRLFLSATTNYLLNGNQLTTTVNGVPNTVTVPNINNVTITGDATSNQITVENFAGQVTINGGGGGDVITVDAGSGGTVTVHDSSPTGGSPDSLIVNAPTAARDNFTLSSGVIADSSGVVNFDSSAGAVSIVGQLISGGDSLTVNASSSQTTAVGPSSVAIGASGPIAYSSFASLTVNGTGASDTINIAGTSIPTTIASGAGADQINVGTSDASIADDVASPLDVISSGSSTLTVDDSANANGKIATLNATTISGISPADITYSGQQKLVLDLAADDNVLTVTATASNTATSIVGGAGDDVFYVQADSSNTTISGGAGNDQIMVGSTAPYAGGVLSTITHPLLLTSAGGADVTLDDSGDASATTSTLNATTFTGIAAGAITIGTVQSVTLNLGTAANTLTISNTITGATTINGGTTSNAITMADDSGPTTINAGVAGTVNIQAAAVAIAIVTDYASSDTINLGSLAPTLSGGTLSGITGGVFITGSGGDTLNLDDTGDSAANTVTISSTDITGAAPSDISYSQLQSLNVDLGNGANSLTISGTDSNTVTSIGAGSGNNTINVQAVDDLTLISTGGGTNAFHVGGLAPASGGTLDGIVAPLQLFGSGADSLTLDDSASSTGKLATLTDTDLSGASAGDISYSGMATLGLSLGSGGDALVVSDTSATTTTTVNTGAGNDTIAIDGDSGVLKVNTQYASDVIDVQAISAATTINTGAGDPGDWINVGSLAPASGGNLQSINAVLTVTGHGADTLDLDNSGNTTGSSRTLALSATAISGLTTSPIAYSGLSSLLIATGPKVTAVNVTNTAVGAAANITTVSSNVSFSVNATQAALTLTTGGGTNTFNIGVNGGETLANLHGAITLAGAGTNTLNIDNSRAATGASGTLSTTTFSLSAASVAFASESALNVKLAAGDSLAVSGIAASMPTSLTAGAGGSISVASAASALSISASAGGDVITVAGSSAAVSIVNSSSSAAADTFNLGAAANGAGAAMDNFAAAVTVTGGGHDALNIDDSAASENKSVTIAPALISGLNASNVVYGGFAELSILLGTGADDAIISQTSAATTLSAGDGSDAITLADTANPATIITGAGTSTVAVDNNHAAATITTSSGPANINVVTTSAPLNIVAGSGNTGVVFGSAAPAISGGTLSALGGSLTVTGGGQTSVTLDDSGASSSFSPVITNNSISGLTAQPINYSDVATLTINLGSGANAVTVNSTSANLTSISGAGANAFTVAPGAAGLNAIVGTLSLYAGASNLPLTIDDSADGAASTYSLSPTSIGGVSYVGFSALTLDLASVDTLTSTGINATMPTTVNGGTLDLNLPGDFTGSLDIGSRTAGTIDMAGNLVGALTGAGGLTSVSVGGALTGSINLGGSLQTVSVGGDLTGSLAAGSIGTLAIAGADSGSITAATSINTITVLSTTPNAAGVLFSASQGGVLRQITATGNATFAVAYDGTAATPSAAVRITAASKSAFNLTLTAPASGWFDLAELDAPQAAGPVGNVRDIVVDGSVLNAHTASQAAFFGYVANSAGGVQLPKDTLGSVAAENQFHVRSINTFSIQAVAFAYIAPDGGAPIAAGAIKTAAQLKTLLALNAKKKVTTKIVSPNQTIEASIGLPAPTVGLFDGRSASGAFDTIGMLFTDEHTSPDSILVQVNYGAGSPHFSVTQIIFDGDGGSILTKLLVSNISSTGPLGDVNLTLGKKEKLKTLVAPSIFGTISLHGGKVLSTVTTDQANPYPH